MTDYIEVAIKIENEDQKDMLVARLSEIGFEGFEENEKLLKAYIPKNDFVEEHTKSILDSQALAYSKSVINQKNWNEEWETGFEPVTIGNFCAIRASFHAPVPEMLHDIIITPKMSFGTGHHATTHLMIEAMGSINFQNKTVIDFGTGTGVLAILAEKLGASFIEAVDNDDWSIENGKENIQMNNCKAISLHKSDSLEMRAKADILLANINKNVITHHFKSICEHLLPGGILLLSGLLVGDFQDIEKLAIQEKLYIKDVKERNSWLCIHIVDN